VKLDVQDLLFLRIGFLLGSGSVILSAQLTVANLLVQALHLVPLSVVLAFACLAQVVLWLKKLSLSLCLPFVQCHLLRFLGYRHYRLVGNFFSAFLLLVVSWWLVQVIDVLLVTAPVALAGSVALVNRLHASFVASRLAITFTLSSVSEGSSSLIALSTSSSSSCHSSSGASARLLKVSVSIQFPIASVVALFAVLAVAASGFVECGPWIVVREAFAF
jgi:hypothetical protein